MINALDQPRQLLYSEKMDIALNLDWNVPCLYSMLHIYRYTPILDKSFHD